jgi:hypothetical protein
MILPLNSGDFTIMTTAKPMIGKTFGRLKIIARAPNSNDGSAAWNCVCECGNEILTLGKKLRNGHIKSCGCLRVDIMKENQRRPAPPSPDGPLTLNRLKEVLHYDPASGDWKWLVRVAWRINAGGRAGTLNTLGYVAIKVDGTVYLAHRLAWFYMTGNWPQEIDHIDRNKSNCRWANLRSVTHAENMQNVDRRVKQPAI